MPYRNEMLQLFGIRQKQMRTRIECISHFGAEECSLKCIPIETRRTSTPSVPTAIPSHQTFDNGENNGQRMTIWWKCDISKNSILLFEFWVRCCRRLRRLHPSNPWQWRLMRWTIVPHTNTHYRSPLYGRCDRKLKCLLKHSIVKISDKANSRSFGARNRYDDSGYGRATTTTDERRYKDTDIECILLFDAISFIEIQNRLRKMTVHCSRIYRISTSTIFKTTCIGVLC